MTHSTTDIASRVEQLISQMTPAEKIGQLIQYFQFLPNDASIEAEVAAGRAGSILFVRDPAEINRLQRLAIEQSRLGIPLLFGFDVIHGFRTIFPVPIAMAASWDMSLIEASQAIAATEARSVGLHWTFAPMVDIARDPRWGRMIEGAGEDPFLGSAIAAAQVRGFQGDTIGQSDRIIAGAKHFVGYGAALGGRDYDEAEVSENELRNVYFPPFKAAFDAGAGNVMCAYMALNGVPATASKWLLTDILRDEWGFDGFAVSDANSAFDLATHNFAKNPADAAVRAINAGLDMEMAMGVNSSAYSTLVASIESGAVDAAHVDRSVRRILGMKMRMGLFDAPYADEGRAVQVLSDLSHREASRTAAERTFVLLRNEADILPLNPGAIQKLAVIGPLADSRRDTLGPWVFDQDLEETVTVLSGIKAKVGGSASVAYAPGVTMIARQNPSFFDMLPGMQPADRVDVDDDAEIARAVTLAVEADCTILVLGEAQNMIGEAASRASLDLPGRQQELLEAVMATGKPVILLLMSARPIDLKGVRPDAVVVIWYPGSQGGAAVANMLFGDADPSGKLPFNWVRSMGQVPLPYGRMQTHKPEDRETRYWDEDGSPLYPFGFGLTYSRCEFGRLMVANEIVSRGEDVEVSVDVTNTGSRPVQDVAQLYIHQRYGTSARPTRQLKGFRRFHLEAGETRTIKITLRAEDLRYWSAHTQDWVQDETVIDLFVGNDAGATLTTHFEVRA